MERHLSRLIGRAAVPVFAGAALGGIAAVAYIAVCGGLYWALTGRADRLPSLVVRFASAGAIAGGLMGFMVALDWAKTGGPKTLFKQRTSRAEPDTARDADEAVVCDPSLNRADHKHLLCGNGLVRPERSGFHNFK